MKKLPKMPDNLPPLPEGYIYLGKRNDIVVPISWNNNEGHWDQLADFAWYKLGEKRWLVSYNKGWLSRYDDIHVAAKINSHLYNINKPRPALKPKPNYKRDLEKANNEIVKLKAENAEMRITLEYIRTTINERLKGAQII